MPDAEQFVPGAAILLAVGSVMMNLASVGAAPRRRLGDAAAVTAVMAAGLVGFWTIANLALVLAGGSSHPVQLLDWLALTAALLAVAGRRWFAASPGLTCAPLYFLLLMALALGWLQRAPAPQRYLVWVALCQLAGFVLVSAGIVWAARSFTHWFTPAANARVMPRWLVHAQAGLTLLTAGLAAWIAVDGSFDGLGKDEALLGLAGRTSACPAALMLLGASILMAWQTPGRWRAVWQYAAFATGVLFTSSVGWAGSGATPFPLSIAAHSWLPGCRTLTLTTLMMATMTRFGLARGLPTHSDWIYRGRIASPFFLAVALCMALLILTAGR